MQRVLLAGFGFMGKKHAEVYHLLADACVVGVVDPRGEDLGESLRASQLDGVPVFASSASAMGEVECSVVDICLPTDLHRSIALEASERLTARAPLGEFDLARATLRSATALLLAGTATLAASLLRGAAQRIEQSAEHIVTLAGRRTTRVRGEDMLDAGSSLSTVETLSLSRSGGSTIMTARQDLRVDAERIGLG
jgi:hypothetical protein